MTADEEQRGDQRGRHPNAVELANAIGAGRFHHVSSIAVAGMLRGHFTEDMFDEGQELTHPYHRTKFESEQIARERGQGAWRVYRPAIVVGNSKTGEMDKIDGPYYFFKAIQKIRNALPQWFPLVSIEWGRTNIVPVDYVAARWTTSPTRTGSTAARSTSSTRSRRRSGDVMNTFARAAHAPHMVMRIDKQMTDMLPKGVISYALQIPALNESAGTSSPTSASPRRSSSTSA